MLEVIIAAVAVVLGASLGSWATVRAARTSQRTALETARTAERTALATARIAKEIKWAQVEIVDAYLATPEDLEDLNEEQRAHLGLTPSWTTRGVLDVKLLNNGAEPAYVYELLVETWDIREGAPPRLPGIPPREGVHGAPPAGHMMPAHFYRGRGRNSGDAGKLYRLSEVLPPGEANRFLLSAELPAGFFRANLKVLFNGGRTAELQDVHCLNRPTWEEADSLRRRLLERLQECGPTATWNGAPMPTSEAAHQCLVEYDEELAALATLYEQASRTSDPEYAALNDSRRLVTHIHHHLYLNRHRWQ
ncbi:hypothetical protein ACFQ8C_21125 [Streptomyces sp. NPDC056503]|uniref:hypothetical protein n=1 Tax=Streptomyces sp. NPDC056503 TaxID=3345842 RepID=UPI0036856579